ncbi:MAG: 6-carboxytetrahydropterin synthase [Acidobacteriota bacterium]|nr:6-carboxytetrahydropterin synthase [Acidobacteriota bacterium]
MDLQSSESLFFDAAVERPLSVVFQTPDGAWEGHDYTVEVIASRRGLDAFDVVMDFRELEAVLDRILMPLQGRLLSDMGLGGPLDLARKLAHELAPHVPAPACLSEVALTDGRGRRLAVRPQ